MGGNGSGRSGAANGTIEGCRSIDVRRWQREGLLHYGAAFSWQWRTADGELTGDIRVHVLSQAANLAYKHKSQGSTWQALNYAVGLARTGCALGGQRPWFLCPARGCGRRVALLYGAGGVFACRYRYRLTYPSQREGHDDRALRRADAILERLGWSPGIWGGHEGKPKGMHWKTYQRLAAVHDSWAELSKSFLMRHFA